MVVSAQFCVCRPPLLPVSCVLHGLHWGASVGGYEGCLSRRPCRGSPRTVPYHCSQTRPHRPCARSSLNATQQHLSLKEGLLAPVAASAALFSCYLLLKYLPALNIQVCWEEGPEGRQACSHGPDNTAEQRRCAPPPPHPSIAGHPKWLLLAAGPRSCWRRLGWACAHGWPLGGAALLDAGPAGGLGGGRARAAAEAQHAGADGPAVPGRGRLGGQR